MGEPVWQIKAQRADNTVILKEGLNIREEKKSVCVYEVVLVIPNHLDRKYFTVLGQIHCYWTKTAVCRPYYSSTVLTLYTYTCNVHVNRTHIYFLPSIQLKWCMQGSEQKHESDLHPVVCLNASHVDTYTEGRSCCCCSATGPLLVPLLCRHSGTKRSHTHHITITSGFHQTVSNGVIVFLTAQYKIFCTVLFCFTFFCCEHFEHVEKDKYCRQVFLLLLGDTQLFRVL